MSLSGFCFHYSIDILVKSFNCSGSVNFVHFLLGLQQVFIANCDREN